ncbi:hypothetical protein ACFXK0_26745 [Nocardia sp. NPDC059177]|uniref:hypothetical protein n=1 Tax=Nocardia sp. NPDC059177 TaxID=3346759 RepID=UPI003682EC41
MRISHAHASFAIVLTATALLTGCSSGQANSDWRSVDMCGIFTNNDLQSVSTEPETLIAEPIDNDNGVGCSYTGISTVELLGSFLKEKDSNLSDLPPFAVKRTFDLGGRTVYVTYEDTGVCQASIQLDGLALGITISPESAKRRTKTPDSEMPGCDFHRSMIEDIVDRTGLS